MPPLPMIEPDKLGTLANVPIGFTLELFNATMLGLNADC
jgi:hypothetical protein